MCSCCGTQKDKELISRKDEILEETKKKIDEENKCH